jgi:hypothetical protein
MTAMGVGRVFGMLLMNKSKRAFTLCAPLVLGAFTPLLAQEQPQSRPEEARASHPSQASQPAETSGRLLTGKERLGEKWTDEQRVNDCKVPANKRGNKPRSDTCASNAAE